MSESFKFLWDACQQASPIVCFLETIAIVVIWRQMKFERVEHRKSENGFTSTVLKHAKVTDKLANALNRLSNKSRRQ